MNGRLEGRRRWTAVAVGVALVAAGSWTSARAVQDPPATYEGVVHQEVYVETSNGYSINVDLCFPAVDIDDTEPAPAPTFGKSDAGFPTIVRYDYGHRAGGSCSVSAFTRAGYVIGIIDTPGVGESTGGPYGKTDAEGNRQDNIAMAEAIDYVGSQEWSNGNVGASGASGNGPTLLGTATQRPVHLKAIIPQITSVDGYASLWPGGMRDLTATFVSCGVVSGASYANNGLYTPPRDQSDVERSVEIRSGQVTEGQKPECAAYNDYKDHPYFDEFWEQNRAPIENITIPVWVWGAWNDLFQTQGPTIEIYTNEGVYRPVSSQDKMLCEGCMSHGRAHPGFDPTTEQLRFWDFYLKGLKNDIPKWLRDGRFRYYNTNETDAEGQPFVRVAPEYPIPGTEYRNFYAASAGGASFDAPTTDGSLTYDYVPGLDTAQQQAASFVSEPLPSDVTITGPLTATIYAQTTAADTDFVVKLFDVDPSGEATKMVTGYLKGVLRSYKTDYRYQGPIPVGEVVKYEVELQPTGWLLAEGHRLQIQVSSSDLMPGTTLGLPLPGVAPNPSPATVTVYASPEYPSHVVLPVIGPRANTAVDADSDGVADSPQP